jgi:hypothetical protein
MNLKSKITWKAYHDAEDDSSEFRPDDALFKGAAA